MFFSLNPVCPQATRDPSYGPQHSLTHPCSTVPLSMSGRGISPKDLLGQQITPQLSGYLPLIYNQSGFGQTLLPRLVRTRQFSQADQTQVSTTVFAVTRLLIGPAVH